MFCSRSKVAFVAVFLLLTLHRAISQRIVIIGAGLSGFSAAAKLIENGYKDIVILEAENRIGGRINSVPFKDGTIDLGAQWVHGQDKNVIYEMVHKHFNLGDSISLGDNYETFRMSNGQQANQKLCRKLSSISNNILEHSYSEMEKFNASLGEFFTTKFKNALNMAKHSEVTAELINQMLDYFHKEVNNEFASPTWFDISARMNALSDETKGNQFLTWKKLGFKTVFDFITKKRPDPSKALDVETKVLLQREVINIKWNPKAFSEKVVISCADSSSYSADYVIFTGSLGVLKERHATLFTPNLPDFKVKAITNIGFGTLGKIFLEFDKPFWPVSDKEWISYSFIWRDEDLSMVKGTDKEWLIDVTSFIRVDEFPNTLEGLLSGRQMRVFEGLNDTKIIDDCMWLLQKFLGQSLSRPIEMRRTRWLTNRNFLGTYSYLSMEAERAKVSPRDLAQTLYDEFNKPVIYFSGEATDDRFPSYAHGAVLSGWRAANELVNFLNKTKT